MAEKSNEKLQLINGSWHFFCHPMVVDLNIGREFTPAEVRERKAEEIEQAREMAAQQLALTCRPEDFKQ